MLEVKRQTAEVVIVPVDFSREEEHKHLISSDFGLAVTAVLADNVGNEIFEFFRYSAKLKRINERFAVGIGIINSVCFVVTLVFAVNVAVAPIYAAQIKRFFSNFPFDAYACNRAVHISGYAVYPGVVCVGKRECSRVRTRVYSPASFGRNARVLHKSLQAFAHCAVGVVADQFFEHAVLLAVIHHCRGVCIGSFDVYGKNIPVDYIGSGLTEVCSVVPSYRVEIFVLNGKVYPVTSRNGCGVARNRHVVAVLCKKLIVRLVAERVLDNVRLCARVRYVCKFGKGKH